MLLAGFVSLDICALARIWHSGYMIGMGSLQSRTGRAAVLSYHIFIIFIHSYQVLQIQFPFLREGRMQ